MEISKDTLARLPHEPGVYLYRNRSGEIIYIGKARDLKKRVNQYFQKDGAMTPKTAKLVADIATLDLIPTTSEFDALMLEARLIRTHMPKYNVVSRDDKSPLYVVITFAETLPRLLLLRRREIAPYERNPQNAVYGPFPSGYVLRMILRQLRSIVPYCTQKQRQGKPCFYTHLGLCSPCPAQIVGMTGAAQTNLSRAYRRNMRRLSALFQGKTSWLSTRYEAEIRSLSRALRFEEAGALKRRLEHLRALSAYKYDPQVFVEQGAERVYEQEMEELLEKLAPYYPSLTALSRIECYDISHLFGEHAVGSMVVLTQGKPDPSQYRKFQIRTVHQISDVAMMREVLARRFNHPEWPAPDLVVVDGGKPQVSAAADVLTALGIALPFIGLAKREEELILPTPLGYSVLRLPLSGKAIKVMQRVRDEAHRFALAYHRSLRGKQLRSDTAV